MELRFVLESVGVKSKIQQYRGGWLIVVSSEHALRASDEIASYQCEAAEQSTERSVAIPTYGGAMVGVSVYAGVLMLVAVLMGRSAFGLDWWLAGQMQAGMVMDGQWWRTITAWSVWNHCGNWHPGAVVLSSRADRSVIRQPRQRRSTAPDAGTVRRRFRAGNIQGDPR